MLTTEEPKIRKAGVDDAETIARQRMRMFEDSGQADAAAMATMTAKFVAWVQPRIADGRYLGWLVEEEGAAIAGAGVWLMDFPPHWMDAEPVRAYLLNFYVNPEYRGARAGVEAAGCDAGGGAAAWDQGDDASCLEVWAADL